MDIGTAVNTRTYRATVAVLEDDGATVEWIRNVLKSDGKLVSVGTNLNKFENLIMSDSKFDVCSIDWKINDITVGPTALSKIKRYERDAGKLVYSAYPVDRAARAGGADTVLRKKMQNYDEYKIEVEKLAKLGLSRQIATRLNELDSPVQLSLNPTPQEEQALFRLSRSVAKKKTIAQESDELHSLLKRRRWWQAFDAVSYSNLPTWEKLALLLECVGAGVEDVAQIFKCSLIDAQRIVHEKKVAANLQHSADKLLSVVAYLLRLSNDETSLMPYYWTASELFARSLSSPPWDASGMYAYLRTSSTEGIENALEWIRSH